jgi:hypothetical protein
MEPPSYMQPVVDLNVFMRHMTAVDVTICMVGAALVPQPPY